jgi:DNA ligase-1
MATFPTLHGDSQSGKTKMWSIRVFERDNCGVIETTHGYLDGKKQVNDKVISEGKNIGKKNETSALQQAINEAQSTWVKKKEAGYFPINIDGDIQKDDDKSGADITNKGRGKGVDEDVPTPMLAHDYNKRAKSINFPCFVQRKYDGTRCVGMPGKGLFSRNRKAYPHLSHIIKEINRLPPTIILDGELYSDTLTFQEIVGLVKRESLKTGDEEKQLQIKFHIYDIINYTMPYEQRYANLQIIFNRYKFKYLELVRTDNCETEEEMKMLHDKFVAEGYEGIMLRNKDGLYKGVRSADLQKYKCFEDGEYKVIGCEDGKGLEEGCVIWKCVTPDGKVFACRPRGTREDRQDMYLNSEKYMGKMLTVRYQELTDTGVPRFPVGISFRDYE